MVPYFTKRNNNNSEIRVIGFHPAALPNNRGRHPIIWAIFWAKVYCKYFFLIDEGTDTGDVISENKINRDDDASTIYDRISLVALNQIYLFLMT